MPDAVRYPAMVRGEAHSKLTSVLSVCEHELAGLEALADGRLRLVIERMHAFRLDLLVAIERLECGLDEDSA
jgi:hypothetical protein